MTATALKDPRRYFDSVGVRETQATAPPVCLYLEVTNRCNLLCETCPRTFESLEPPADMSWKLFTSIVDQSPGVARAVLHGVGEPMLVKALPRMIRYLKDRGVYVLFNTNGTLLSAHKHQAMIDTGLDELRVSLDAADAKTFLAVRGKNFFERIVRNVRSFTELQRATGAASPRVSLWLTGLKETIDQLSAFVHLAASMGVREVYLQRLVYDEAGYGLARAESSLFERLRAGESHAIEAAAGLARELGIALDASGATEPGLSLKRQDDTQPWSACRRPWSLMYVTAHGRALPCCMAPFSARGYDSYTLGDATQQTLREIWNGAAYQDFRGALLSDDAAAPLRRLRVALEPVIEPFMLPNGVAAVIPTLNEAETIAGAIASIPRDLVDEIIVADSSSRDGTAAIAQAAGARVVTLTDHGYGRACAAGAAAAGAGCGIILFLDGDGADRADLAALLVAPIRAGTHDFVIGSRVRGVREPGSMNWHQVLAGRLAGRLMSSLYGVRYTDMCAFRAIRRDALDRLGLRETTYGWNIEMQMKAARAGLRILELPVPYRRRAGGSSKVAGSLGGSVRAAWRITLTIARVATAGR